MDGDEWGCALAVVAVIGGGIWLYNNYELRKIEAAEPAVEAIEPYTLPRPTEPMNITATKNGAEYTLDPNTVSGDRSGRRGWITIDYSKDSSVSYRTSKQLVWVNCDTGEQKTLSYINYDKDGGVVATNDWSFDDAEVAYYPPDTIGYAPQREMCREVYDPPSDVSEPVLK